jgi:hypothetical protein
MCRSMLPSVHNNWTIRRSNASKSNSPISSIVTEPSVCKRQHRQLDRWTRHNYLTSMWNGDCLLLLFDVLEKIVRCRHVAICTSIEYQRKIDPRHANGHTVRCKTTLCSLRSNCFINLCSDIHRSIWLTNKWTWSQHHTNHEDIRVAHRINASILFFSSMEIKSILFISKTSAMATCLLFVG